MVEIVSLVLEEKIVNFFFPVGVDLHLNKLESPSLKDSLSQVWLKLTQSFWRRRSKCEKFTPTKTTATTDNGHILFRKAPLSLQLSSAQVSLKKITREITRNLPDFKYVIYVYAKRGFSLSFSCAVLLFSYKSNIKFTTKFLLVMLFIFSLC